MKFVNPNFLYALFFLSIPIIIHLFNFKKYKKVYFTNVRFLKEIKEETQQTSTIKHLLVLLSRLLALTFLIFAFAQPYIPSNKNLQSIENNISIYIDNSFSMDAVGESGRLLDVAKNLALSIAENFSPTDKSQVITNDFERKHQKFNNQQTTIDYITEIQNSSHNKKLSVVLNKQQEQLLEFEKSNKEIFLISDFQKTICDWEQLKVDTNIQISIFPFTPALYDNISIDSVWFETPIRQYMQEEKLKVRIKNHSDKKIENLPVTLTINNQPKAKININIYPNEYADSTFVFTNNQSGFQLGNIEIKDYPISHDDQFYFSYRIEPQIKVLSLFENQPNTYLHKLFFNDAYIDLKQSNIFQLNYNDIQQYNAIIFDDVNQINSGNTAAIKNLLEKGKSVFISLGNNLELSTYNRFADELGLSNINKKDTAKLYINQINLDDPFFKDVFKEIPKNMDFPYFNSYYPASTITNKNATSLLSLQNGYSVLERYNQYQGKLYVYYADLNNKKNNFTQHALFVPIFYKMIINSLNTSNLYYTLSENNQIVVNKPIEDVLTIASTQFDNEFIPEIQKRDNETLLFIHQQINLSGNYLVKQNSDTLDVLSMNYHHKESINSYYQAEEIKEIVKQNNWKNITVFDTINLSDFKQIKLLNEENDYWKFCILLVLVFLAIETLLIRFWKP
jgi:hypothetical protein